ncbi:PREDICTED: reverse mRNAase [Prunus dulcis]|uniref:PREDICTED: reverse mRNAase n=1 Tax=Prunus dulcis TaxID=3755 RepID=A0A5E4GGP3_PRUDU|nr:PREDICTED: reverse mRNAase [Prunus dulcis]
MVERDWLLTHICFFMLDLDNELPPRNGWIKVNFDSAWGWSSHKAGLGVVARGSNGLLIGGMAIPTRSSSVLMVEALAALHALARLGRSRMPSPISNGTGSPAKGIELPTSQHR